MERRIGELERFQRYTEKPLAGFPHPSTIQTDQNTELQETLAERIHSELGVQETLEESLRAELLQCERQRAYIAVLEQAVQDRLTSSQFSGSFDEFIAVPQVQMEIDMLKGQMEGIKAVLETIETEEQSLEVTVETILPLERETSQAIQEIADNGLKAQNAEEQVSRLTEEIATLKDYVERARGLEALLNQLEAEDTELQQKFAETEDRNKAENKLAGELATKAVDHKRYSSELEVMRTEREQMSSQLGLVTAKVESEEAIVTELELSLQMLVKQREDLEAQVRDLSEEEMQANQGYKEVAADLKDTQTRLDAELAAIESADREDFESIQVHSSLQTRYQSLIDQVQCTTEAAITLRNTLTEMRKTAGKEQERTQGQLESWDREMEALISKSTSLVMEVQAAQRHASDLQTDLTALNAAGRELPSIIHSEVQLHQQILEISAAISAAKREMDRLMQARSTLRARLLAFTHT
jgi:hypothetical protein